MNESSRTAQLKKVFESWYESPLTMLECEYKTGIMRSNICWYCRDLRKSNKLFISKKRFCSITKRFVNEYTTNPKFAARNDQFQLF